MSSGATKRTSCLSRLSLSMMIVTSIIVLYIIIFLNNSSKYDWPSLATIRYGRFETAQLDSNISLFLYSLSAMTPRKMWTINELKHVNESIIPPPYGDTSFLKDCEVAKVRKTLYKLLFWWIKFAAQHNIYWWLRDGTLIGAIRHRDIVPWDHDMDLAVPQQYESLIRNMATNRGDINSKKVNLVVRPGPHCPYNGDRLDCKGRSVSFQADGCAFCGPMARIFYTSGQRIDLYLVDVQVPHGHDKDLNFSGMNSSMLLNQLALYDESHFEYTDVPTQYPLKWFLPLRECTIMGLSVLCPKLSEHILTSYYGNFSSKHICSNKKWTKI